MGERITVPIQLRWGDLDAQAHVNNVTMLKILEEARVRVLWDGDEWTGEGIVTLIARQEIEYLAPMPYTSDPVRVELWISRMGGSSLELSYEILPPAGQGEAPYARATGVIVFADAVTGRPTRLDPAKRAKWEPYLGERVEFRR